MDTKMVEEEAPLAVLNMGKKTRTTKAGSLDMRVSRDEIRNAGIILELLKSIPQ